MYEDEIDEIEVSTKYFGNIIVNVDKCGNCDAYIDYNNQEIVIFFSDYNIYDDKGKMLLEIVDKYFEINEIAKKSIIEYFHKSKLLKYYFKWHFEMLRKSTIMELFGVTSFKKMDIKNIVEKLKYPTLHCSMENGEKRISLAYMVSEFYTEEILSVKMNDRLKITGFLHES